MPGPVRAAFAGVPDVGLPGRQLADFPRWAGCVVPGNLPMGMWRDISTPWGARRSRGSKSSAPLPARRADWPISGRCTGRPAVRHRYDGRYMRVTAECLKPGRRETGGGLRCREAVDEVHRDRRMQLGENGFSAGPVLVWQCRRLVDCRDAQRELIVALAGQRLQLEGFGQGRRQHGQAVDVGAGVIGQLERVARVVLGSCCSPPWTWGVEGIGVHRETTAVSFEVDSSPLRNREPLPEAH